MPGFSNVAFGLGHLDLATLEKPMFSLMLRNVAAEGYCFSDPMATGGVSAPGCIIAAPSRPDDVGSGFQDYVFNWPRDAALVAMEMAATSLLSPGPTGARQPLVDYVNFVALCQKSGAPLDHGCFTIEGQPRPWSDQSDGPALQVIALLAALPYLDGPSQAVADTIIAGNIAFLLTAYGRPTTNLWEDKTGYSFFARSVQLRALQAALASGAAPASQAQLPAAINDLQTALAGHWDASAGYYQSVLPPPAAYDPNIDVVLASVYGAVACTDSKLLATAAKLRDQWSAPASATAYPVNAADAALQLGPLMGRYPGDQYDGDVTDEGQVPPGDHPWALCTCNFAQLYYDLATQVQSSGQLPLDDLSAPFFAQVGVGTGTAVPDGVAGLRAAGDRMLLAVVWHSDYLELSEQFDGTTGYEKSVKNLTWSFASFLSALRAR